jgi:thioredoxin reductase (NADPH)
MVVRGDSLTRSMSDYLIQEIEVAPNITVRLHTEVVEIRGARHMEGVTLHDRARDAREELPADALFILIGGEPRTQLLRGVVQLERQGYILTGRDVTRDGNTATAWPLDRAPLPLETSMPGVFAAGDARFRSIKRVASAVGDGATAVRLAHEYLEPEGAAELALIREP